jgi:hypothetical protein
MTGNNNVEDTSLTLQKMVFIYNALLKGWTIRMIENDKFEFTKDLESIKKEVDLADYLRKFIQYNLNIENLRTI